MGRSVLRHAPKKSKDSKRKAAETVEEEHVKNDPKLIACEKSIRQFVGWITKTNFVAGGIGEWFTKNVENVTPDKPSDSISKSNQSKNRNPEVTCLDETRVKLQEDNLNDYIHANWINTPSAEKCYIVTQHPLETTIPDFWRMVFYENVDTVIYISSHEDNLPAYFPTEAGKYQNHGVFFINTRRVQPPTSSFSPTEYTVEVLPEGCSNSRMVTVLHCDEWNKNQVPTNAKVINRIRRLIKTDKTTKGPVVVHCSTGCNRAGSFILASVIEDQIFRGNEIDVPTIVKSLRDQRFHLFQNRIMFLYALHTVTDYIRLRCKKSGLYPDLVKETENFKKSFEKLITSKELVPTKKPKEVTED